MSRVEVEWKSIDFVTIDNVQMMHNFVEIVYKFP